MTAGFINSASVTLSGCFDNGGGNVLNYNKLHSASNGLAIWLCAFVGCFLSIAAAAAKASPSESVTAEVAEGSPLGSVPAAAADDSPSGSGVTSMRAVVIAKSSSTPDDRHDTTSFSVYYRSAVSRIERGFRNNAASLDAASEGLRSVVHNNNLRIFKVYIIGAASPEGRPGLNARLARDRAEGVKAFLKGIEPRLTDSDFVVISRGEDWDGATKIAELYDKENEGDAVAGIFKSSQDSEAKKRLMKSIHGGDAWRRLISDYYPALRRTDIHVLYSIVQPIAPVKSEMPGMTLEVPYSYNIAPRTVLPEVGLPDPVEERFYFVAVKTNLLYDAAIALNFAVEFPLGDRFSLQYEQVFPWWNAGPHGNKYSMQVLSFGVETRWWFAPRTPGGASGTNSKDAVRQRSRLLGHFLGLYAHSGKFDIQAGRKFGCYQNYFKGAGLSYGYSLPLGRNANMEFAISLGYMAIDYQHYIPSEDWSVLLKDNGKAGTKHYFGPTKAKVSVVFPIVFKCGGTSK